MLRFKHFWSFLICILILNTVEISSSSPSSVSSTAPIPHNKKGNFFVGNTLINRLVREAKISFCSELEGLTLQLTRPSTSAIPTTQLEDLLNFVNHEYDNPELLISLLVKLSRKFAEPNIYTQLKTGYLLHYLMDKIDTSAKEEYSKAIQSMRSELDEKLGQSYFSLESINDAIAAATTVLELETVEFTRLFIQYLFEYIQYQQKQLHLQQQLSLISLKEATKAADEKKGTTSRGKRMNGIPSISSIVEIAERLMKLLETNDKLLHLIDKKLENELMEQFTEGLVGNQQRLLDELIDIYENNRDLDSHLDQEILTLIQYYQPKFAKINRSAAPMESKPTEEKESNSNVKEKPLTQRTEPSSSPLENSTPSKTGKENEQAHSNQSLPFERTSKASEDKNKPKHTVAERKNKEDSKAVPSSREEKKISKSIPSIFERSLQKSISLTPTKLPSGAQLAAASTDDSERNIKQIPQIGATNKDATPATVRKLSSKNSTVSSTAKPPTSSKPTAMLASTADPKVKNTTQISQPPKKNYDKKQVPPDKKSAASNKIKKPTNSSRGKK